MLALTHLTYLRPAWRNACRRRLGLSSVHLTTWNTSTEAATVSTHEGTGREEGDSEETPNSCETSFSIAHCCSAHSNVRFRSAARLASTPQKLAPPRRGCLHSCLPASTSGRRGARNFVDEIVSTQQQARSPSLYDTWMLWSRRRAPHSASESIFHVPLCC